MKRVIVVPPEITEFELRDKDVEVLYLHKKVERLDIQMAPSLKKIIFLGEYITFGPKEPRITVPALNRAGKLNEIITTGYINFNTFTLNNGFPVRTGWVSLTGEPPVLTSVGEYPGDFPCYYYDLYASSEHSKLISAEPIVRECSPRYYEFAVMNAVDHPDFVSQEILTLKRTTVVPKKDPVKKKERNKKKSARKRR